MEEVVLVLSFILALAQPISPPLIASWLFVLELEVAKMMEHVFLPMSAIAPQDGWAPTAQPQFVKLVVTTEFAVDQMFANAMLVGQELNATWQKMSVREPILHATIEPPASIWLPLMVVTIALLALLHILLEAHSSTGVILPMQLLSPEAV